VTILLHLTTKGFADGLFEEEELSMGSGVSDEDKMWLLARLFAFVGALTGQRLALRPSDVVFARSPTQTLFFMSGLARIAKVTPPEQVAAAVARVHSATAAAEAKKQAAREAPERQKPRSHAVPSGLTSLSSLPGSSVASLATADPAAAQSMSTLALAGSSSRAGLVTSLVSDPGERGPSTDPAVASSGRRRRKNTKRSKPGTATKATKAKAASGVSDRAGAGESLSLRPKGSRGGQKKGSDMYEPPASAEATALGGRNLFDREWLEGFDFRMRSLVKHLHTNQYGRAEAAPIPGGVVEPLVLDEEGNPVAPTVGGAVSGIGILSPAQLRTARHVASSSGTGGE
jgi:hypothetical protein